MSLPESFHGRLRLPLIAAPMFLVSGPQLVIETCKAGVIGTFPALNQRSSEGFEQWLEEINAALQAHERDSGVPAAPFGVNLIVHPSNPRLKADLMLCVKHRVPLVITSLGAVKEVVDAVHSYGGLVFHDVTNIRHAKKAAAAGVDGLIAVCGGAGGHAGTLSPFALVNEIRQFFDGVVILSGSLSSGQDLAAARMLGADLGYMGTRFINTRESMAADDYKDMIIGSRAADIVYTPKVSGIPASFMRQSLEAAGLLDTEHDASKPVDMSDEAKAWKTVWSAGQGVGSIEDVPSTAELVARLKHEYTEAGQQFAADSLQYRD
ncbi:2-nitropropane dioxygenase [Marinobacterium aestuarii]|uniref:2-nitropropane dioxygenase n=1 Tax=Marinobacterium aestuarii TaxID=1821621 RepID=A0A1A9F2B7_9GAMM|nr:nitronate monooxygenase family protein [Marinobacterium aestuarii]ANG64305.1 2-nitropropane dioxygenase [Marinobacterium aestuarii]